ncbi:MAG: hypothetical protein KGH64_01800 [Candidatus Micrarchaeota archaeon]|nr:hypothetical protein [Candidatus Micrarchaeota archaeon]MDE1834050.1 hypothetical protein [Candidatus Micrarchaeota archaeon]MDE1859183.1 hypothetical protein [Candidatus Micrarchaeota archaeon]
MVSFSSSPFGNVNSGGSFNPAYSQTPQAQAAKKAAQQASQPPQQLSAPDTEEEPTVVHLPSVDIQAIAGRNLFAAENQTPPQAVNVPVPVVPTPIEFNASLQSAGSQVSHPVLPGLQGRPVRVGNKIIFV